MANTHQSVGSRSACRAETSTNSIAESRDVGNVLVVVPWLEGGGAQRALEGILSALTQTTVTLLIIFAGNRNHGRVLKLVDEVIQLEQPRTIWGVWRASKQVRRYVRQARTVYSLLRASHLVLGIGSVGLLRKRRFVASYHQLPTTDSRGLRGLLEDLPIRHAMSAVELVTSPSERAVRELKQRRFAASRKIQFDANLMKLNSEGARLTPAGGRPAVRLLFAGRLSQQKGLEQIPELANGCSQVFHLRIVGDGELRDLAQALPRLVDDRHTIEVVGHVDDLQSELDWSDAVLMPSRWELNPVVVWEAWSRGRPVLASELDVFRDLSKVGPVQCFANESEFAKLIERTAVDEVWRNESFDRALDAVRFNPARSRIVEYLGG